MSRVIFAGADAVSVFPLHPAIAAMNTLGYDLYRHPAPIWERENFFENPVNHWAPTNVCSLMVLGIPAERKVEIVGLHRVSSPDDWWKM